MFKYGDISKFVDSFCLIVKRASRQQIIGLGYPEILARLISDKFGKNAFLIARWMKEHHSWGNRNFMQSIGIFGRPQLENLLGMYAAALNGVDAYKAYLEKEDFDYWSPATDVDLENSKKALEYEIRDSFYGVGFFRSTLISAIENGTLKNLQPYKNLPFEEALQKYRQKTIFEEMTPLKVYDDGFKWVNVGPRCELIRDKMKNCGSSGVMSMDPDSTMLSLFSPDNVPKVILTLSPNDKKISGVEGVYHSGAKEKYHSYILDIINQLGVEYDPNNSPKSKMLFLKYQLKNIAKSIESVYSGTFTTVFKFVDYDDNVFYTDSYQILPGKAVKEAIGVFKKDKEKMKKMRQFSEGLIEDINLIAHLFANGHNLRDMVNFTSMFNFLKSRNAISWMNQEEQA